MEKDLKEFTIVIKTTLFVITSHISLLQKKKINSKIILAINNIFVHNNDFKGVLVYRINLTHSIIIYFAISDVATTTFLVTILEFKIKNLFDYTQYKEDMKFNECTIYVTNISLQMKPSTIKQVFTKYESIIDFKMTAKGI
ncbi:6303_t:CDS:1 [Funneliformis geosporum]|uniref:6303_t:CDS:1 n=1 Tax=Funneliformis geosporum TaxID=1117311 RepID=A0A9W4WZC6_9GLOM|nr:6303_t:CDS:1 [Funneliformis geosporum]